MSENSLRKRISKRFDYFKRSNKDTDKSTRRKRDTTINLSSLQEIGREFFNRILQVLIVTLTATIVYWIFFPLSATYLFNLFGVEGNFPIAPQFTSSIDYYAMYGFILFILIQIAIIRIFFIRDNQMLLVSAISGVISFSIMVLINFYLYPLITFIYGTDTTSRPVIVGEGSLPQPIPQTQVFGVTISNLNLFGFIILYDVVFLFSTLTLLRNRRDKEMKN